MHSVGHDPEERGSGSLQVYDELPPRAEDRKSFVRPLIEDFEDGLVLCLVEYAVDAIPSCLNRIARQSDHFLIMINLPELILWHLLHQCLCKVPLDA